MDIFCSILLMDVFFLFYSTNGTLVDNNKVKKDQVNYTILTNTSTNVVCHYYISHSVIM